MSERCVISSVSIENFDYRYHIENWAEGISEDHLRVSYDEWDKTKKDWASVVSLEMPFEDLEALYLGIKKALGK